MSPRTQVRLKLGHAANLLLASSPRFVIMASPRSGTDFTAKYLTAIGVRCSHEGYFTPEGPTFFNKDRRFGAQGDASWMSIPFAREMKLMRLHQTRHPWAVIASLYRLGFFEPSLRQRYRRYRDFIDQHFEVSDCPLDSSIRWYIEWNARCEAQAHLRYRVEDMEIALPKILAAIGATSLRPHAEVPHDTNTRPSAIGARWEEGLGRRVLAHPRFEELDAVARHYGYAGAAPPDVAAAAAASNV
jgi:hypothetical protein